MSNCHLTCKRLGHNVSKFHPPLPFLNKRDIVFHGDLAMALRPRLAFLRMT